MELMVPVPLDMGDGFVKGLCKPTPRHTFLKGQSPGIYPELIQWGLGAIKNRQKGSI